MDGAITTLKEKLNQLLTEAAQISVALDRADGTITGVPHYSVIEARDSNSVVRSKPGRWGSWLRGGQPQPPVRSAKPVVISTSRNAR
jgi:hypothetical protein